MLIAMLTDDLTRTISMGIFATLLAFEFVAAMQSWLAAREGGGLASRQVLWLSRPFAIKARLAARRHEFDAVRWQYPVLRSARRGHEIRNAIRRLHRHPDWPMRPRRANLRRLQSLRSWQGAPLGQHRH